MKILIKNAQLISMNEIGKSKIQKEIDVLIKDNKIIKIEKNINEQVDKIIDAKNKIVMPGLINTHAHIPMSLFRETVDGYITQEWLEKKIWPIEDNLTEEDVYYAAVLTFLEMIYSGTTTANDMYFLPEGIIKAVKDTGIRIQMSRCLMDIDGNGESRKKELEKLLEKYSNKNETISFNIGIHGFYTNSEKNIEESVKLAKKYKLPINMHFCENQQEVEDIKNMYNVKSVVEPIKKYFKNSHLILAHSVKLKDEEIEQLAKLKNIYIAHCPISNLKLGCGIANIPKMREEKICVSIGTDGQGSGSNMDMFEEMKFTALLQKGILEDPKQLPAYEVLKMATINGAKTLGLENEIGSIEEGKKADIIIIDLNKSPLTNPKNDIISEIVYNVKAENIDTTIVNGKILMENKEFKININPQEIYKKCNEIISRITNKNIEIQSKRN